MAYEERREVAHPLTMGRRKPIPVSEPRYAHIYQYANLSGGRRMGGRTGRARLLHGVFENVVERLARQLAGPHEDDRELARLHGERGVGRLLVEEHGPVRNGQHKYEAGWATHHKQDGAQGYKRK